MTNSTIPAYRAITNRLIEQAAQAEERRILDARAFLGTPRLAGIPAAREAYLDGVEDRRGLGARLDAAVEWDAAEARFRDLMAQYRGQAPWENAMEYAADHLDGCPADGALYDAIISAFEAGE